MITAVKRAGVALLVSGAACTALPACSSDTAPQPEAELETPGAFTALDEDQDADGIGPLVLYRTLDTLSLPNDVVLFATIYDVEPASWDEARELAKSHDIPIRAELQFVSRASLDAYEHRVVWFRTLTDEEKERIP